MKKIDEKLSNVLVEFSKVLNEVTQNSIDGITTFVESFVERLIEINSLGISEERKIELESNCNAFINKGWMISSLLPLTDITQSRNEFITDEYYINSHSDKVKEKVYLKYESYFTKDDLDEFKSLLEHKNHKAACLFLIVILEALISEHFPEYLKGTMFNKEKATKQIHEEILSLGLEIRNVLLYLRGHSLALYFEELYKSSKNFVDNDADFKILNRHYLIHGRTKRTYSYKDCLSLMIFVYELLLYYEKTK